MGTGRVLVSCSVPFYLVPLKFAHLVFAHHLTVHPIKLYGKVKGHNVGKSDSHGYILPIGRAAQLIGGLMTGPPAVKSGAPMYQFVGTDGTVIHG